MAWWGENGCDLVGDQVSAIRGTRVQGTSLAFSSPTTETGRKVCQSSVGVPQGFLVGFGGTNNPVNHVSLSILNYSLELCEDTFS